MKTIKNVSIFRNAAMSYDYKKIGFFEEFYRARRCIINNFHKTILDERILIPLSIIDVVILKIIDNDIENIIENNHDLRATIKNMIGFEKVVENDVDKLMN